MESISYFIMLFNEVQEPILNTTMRIKIPHNQQEYLSAFVVGVINSNTQKVA
jgi:hypothetical protein